jgi:glycosyltransferase involved in cell wall biosynthesis
VRILYHHRTQAEDGQAVHIRSLQQALREEGATLHEFALVARAGSAAGGSERSHWSRLARMPRFARELAEYAYTTFARPKLIRAGQASQAQLLYERYAMGNLAGLQAARALRIPLILEVNSPMVLELSRTRGLVFPKLAARVERHLFQGAQRVVAVSGVLADMIEGMGVPRERIVVMPNGVHLEHYAHWREPAARTAARKSLGLEPHEFALGFVGYYRQWHRLDLALEALMRPELASVVLVLVGEGPAGEALEQRARELGLERRLRRLPPRPHSDVPALLPGFDLALVPAINAYASPLKLTEYMAAGLASVAPDQPNLRELLVDGENALLFVPGSGASLGAALARAASDPALRARLGAAARATVEQRDLTWRGNARRVLALAKELSP